MRPGQEAASRIRVLPHIVARLCELSAAAAPAEACALLIGRDRTVTRVVPVTNHSEAEDCFVVDPLDVIETERACTSDEWMLGLFHSHPRGPAEPSETDLHGLRVWAPQIWLIRGRSGVFRAFRACRIGGYEEVRVLSSAPS